MRHDVSQALGRAMASRGMDAEARDKLRQQYASAASLDELPDWVAQLTGGARPAGPTKGR